MLGDVGDDGALAARQRVEQRTLAGIGRADQYHVQAVAQAPPAFGGATQQRELVARLAQAFAQRGTSQRVQRLVGEVDRCLDVHADRQHRLHQCLDAAGKVAFGERRAARAARRSVAAMRSATASAWARSSLPLRKARWLNSPAVTGAHRGRYSFLQIAVGILLGLNTIFRLNP